MPCKICRLNGHNSRTCQMAENNVLISSSSSSLSSLSLSPKVGRAVSTIKKRFFCYILQQKQPLNEKSLTYVGYTVNYERRIRQHNSIISGGAFITKNKGPWEFLSVM